MGFYGPLSIFGFALLAAILNKFLMGPVVRAVFKQEAKEGDFRYCSDVVSDDGSSSGEGDC